jgi:hypothetical protein
MSNATPEKASHLEAALTYYRQLNGGKGDAQQLVPLIREHLKLAMIDDAVLKAMFQKSAENIERELASYLSGDAARKNGARNSRVLGASTSRLEQIGREILDIAAGRTEICTTVSHQPGGIVTERTEVRSISSKSRPSNESPSR